MADSSVANSGASGGNEPTENVRSDGPGFEPEAEEEKDPFTCPVCMDVVIDPQSLPCGHTVCNTCLQGLVRHAGWYGPKCPECRKTFNSRLVAPNYGLKRVLSAHYEGGLKIRTNPPSELNLVPLPAAALGPAAPGASRPAGAEQPNGSGGAKRFCRSPLTVAASTGVGVAGNPNAWLVTQDLISLQDGTGFTRSGTRSWTKKDWRKLGFAYDAFLQYDQNLAIAKKNAGPLPSFLPSFLFGPPCCGGYLPGVSLRRVRR